MTVRAKQARRRARRAQRSQQRIEAASYLTTDTRWTPPARGFPNGHPYVVGMCRGKVVYASKPLNSTSVLSNVKQRWLRRAAKRRWG